MTTSTTLNTYIKERSMSSSSSKIGTVVLAAFTAVAFIVVSFVGYFETKKSESSEISIGSILIPVESKLSSIEVEILPERTNPIFSIECVGPGFNVTVFDRFTHVLQMPDVLVTGNFSQQYAVTFKRDDSTPTASVLVPSKFAEAAREHSKGDFFERDLQGFYITAESLCSDAVLELK